MVKLDWFKLLILSGILLLGFAARLYRFDGPIADWHSWRQADTSAVSRNFISSGFDVLHPRADDLSNVPTTGKYDNPNGYRFVEFPIYNVFQAGLYKIFDRFTLEEWGRLVTIISSLFSMVFVYLLVKKYADETVALFAVFLYALIPFNIYFGRVILPDPMMVTGVLGGIYFFDLWIEENKKSTPVLKKIVLFLLASLFTMFSLLLKPFAIFFTLPMAAIAFNAYGFSLIKKWQLWIFLIISILPVAFWRVWILSYPEGIPDSAWLFNGGGIRFTAAFFRWIFAERVGGLILGFYGIPLLILGILLNSKSEKAFSYRRGQQLLFWAFLISSLTYLIIVARGNVQHDYYQIPIIPSIVIFAGLGSKFLLNPPKEFINKYISIATLIVCIVFGLSFRWYVVRDFFNINNRSIISAGAAVDRLTPKNAKVIANYNGDTSFLYQTKRKGWASYEKDLPVMVNKLGADYLAIASPTPADAYFEKYYKIVEKTPQYVIFDLHKNPWSR